MATYPSRWYAGGQAIAAWHGSEKGGPRTVCEGLQRRGASTTNAGLPPPTATSGSTSSSLIARVKAREPEAWRRLVELYGPLVYRCVPTSDAPDIVQEAFRAVSA